jgi:two-component system response regulator FlrC
MLAYDWPGNIRELENIIQRALVICHGYVIESSDLILEGIGALSPIINTDQSASVDEQILGQDFKRHEQELILQALRRGNGSRKYAAETLGISPRTLRYKLSRMRDQGVEIPDARGVLPA